MWRILTFNKLEVRQPWLPKKHSSCMNSACKFYSKHPESLYINKVIYCLYRFISKRKSIKATKSTGRRILDALATNKEYRQRMSSFQDRSTD